MDFAYDDTTRRAAGSGYSRFMDECVYPAEPRSERKSIHSMTGGDTRRSSRS